MIWETQLGAAGAFQAEGPPGRKRVLVWDRAGGGQLPAGERDVVGKAARALGAPS